MEASLFIESALKKASCRPWLMPLVLAAGDLLAVGAAWSVCVLVRHVLGGAFPLSAYFSLWPLSGLYLAIYAALGGYRVLLHPPREMKICVLGTSLAALIFAALTFWLRNPYAGTCEEVRVRLGDAVKAGDVLAVYRLDDQDHDAIRQALRPGKLHARREELRLLDVQSQEAAARVERLEDAVRVGVESRARLEREASGLDMLDRQRAALREEIRELSENLAEERARVRRELGGVPVSSENVPWEALLRAPADGLVSDLKLGPRMEMVKNKLCFSVARPIFHAECRIGPDRYVRLTAGDTGRVTIQSLGDREFEGVLLPLPLTAEDKGPAAASYLVHFLIKDLDLFVSEGVRVKVVLDK
ncbi:hypothetical protein [Desulfovibrio aminophilus]|uniref:hypothetical protein n=1 Tax=Desulfovibrio aminophilus TaxID=81425 RepID=UPI0004195F7D|nr:hypothetical protein [Desulfovibrio aminophilus]